MSGDQRHESPEQAHEGLRVGDGQSTIGWHVEDGHEGCAVGVEGAVGRDYSDA